MKVLSTRQLYENHSKPTSRTSVFVTKSVSYPAGMCGIAYFREVVGVWWMANVVSNRVAREHEQFANIRVRLVSDNDRELPNIRIKVFPNTNQTRTKAHSEFRKRLQNFNQNKFLAIENLNLMLLSVVWIPFGFISPINLQKLARKTKYFRER